MGSGQAVIDRANVIRAETVRVRYISDVLDGSKVRAVKVDALFGEDNKHRELAWLRPSDAETFIKGPLGDKEALEKICTTLRTEVAGMTRSRAQRHICRIIRMSKI